MYTGSSSIPASDVSTEGAVLPSWTLFLAVQTRGRGAFGRRGQWIRDVFISQGKAGQIVDGILRCTIPAVGQAP